MAFLPGENDSSMARVQLEALALEISALNDKKRGWQQAWEIESQRQGDPNLEKPPELRALNKQLGPLYGRKEDLLRQFPHLQAEYGGKRQIKREPLSTVANSVVKKERAARKKANHERNLERRREEDRKRAHGGTGGGNRSQKQR
jgi:hypothetical protein